MKLRITILSLCLYFSGALYAQVQPSPKPINCEEISEMVDGLNDLLNSYCNGGVGPFPENMVDACLFLLELRDDTQDIYNRHCTTMV